MPLYVSPVKGHLAPRHGTQRVTPGTMVPHTLRYGRAGVSRQSRVLTLRQPGVVKGHELIGVTRVRALAPDGKTPLSPEHGDITWNESLVAIISDAELAQHRTEYMRLIADGALKERTKADYDAWIAAEEARAKSHMAKIEAEKAAATAKAAEGEAAAVPTPSAPESTHATAP